MTVSDIYNFPDVVRGWNLNACIIASTYNPWVFTLYRALKVSISDNRFIFDIKGSSRLILYAVGCPD